MHSRIVVAALSVLLAGAAEPIPQVVQSSAGRLPGPVAGTGVADVDPTLVELEEALLADPVAQGAWLRRVAVELSRESPMTVARLQGQVAGFMQLRSQRLARVNKQWTPQECAALSALLVVDPRRFRYDTEFRAAVAPVLRDGLSPEIPMGVRRYILGNLWNLEFTTSEMIEVAWGLAARHSREREVPFDTWPARPGSLAPIKASIYSLPTAFFGLHDATEFLRGVHAYAPERDLVVLTGAPLIDELRPLAEEMPLHLIDTLGRRFTPWPRDPFMVVSPPVGPVTVITRPNLQAHREADVFMGRELVQGLPAALDEAWGGVEWTIAPVPFHGGHTLATPGTTWASIHTLLPRIIEILGGTPTPQSLATDAGLEQFITATETAKREFEQVFGQPLRFVHRIPERDESQHQDFAVMLIGGGTSDLDSLVTMLPRQDGGLTALVADFELGDELLRRAPVAEIDELARTYSIVPTGEQLRRELLGLPDIPQDRLIGAFLDETAAFLESEGLRVLRLPLLKVPESLLVDELQVGQDGFLVTLTNVVLEADEGHHLAEGFGSGLASFDEAARGTFAEAGYELRFSPVLARSVIRGGGYRCASNHVR